MIVTYKYRLFTNANQERELAIMLETHRRLYNAIIDGKSLCWEMAKANWTFFEQSKWFTIQRRHNPFFARIKHKSGTLTIKRADNACRAFIKGKGGRARFRGKDRMRSFAFQTGDGFKITADGKLLIHSVGEIRVKWHRELPTDGRIKQVRIVINGEKWFAVFAVETHASNMVASPDRSGIDVGLKSFVTTSQGESIGDSKTLERSLPELSRRQRALSRCKLGSATRKIVKRGVTRLYAKVRNTRLDLHHKVARSLVDRYGFIAAERLNVKGLLGNRRLSRRIADAGWSQFIRILCSKAESAGGMVILVDPKNTSQDCSECGATVKKTLNVRVHQCACGCVLDRDVNAARNILARAAPEGRNVNTSLHGPKSRQRKLKV